MKKFRFALTALLCCLLPLSSCKKDKDDTDKDYLSGSLSMDIPAYLKYGDVVHVVPAGVYRGDDKADTLLWFSWKDPMTGVVDTLRKEGEDTPVTFDFTVSKDTLGTFSVVGYCWAEGYYITSGAASFTTVHPGFGEDASLQGYDFSETLQSFTDTRDSREYLYTTVAGKDWMIQNLAYDGSGEAYKFAEAAGDIFGRYYTWDEACTACPEGWSLASDSDFTDLCAAAGAAATVPHGDVPGVAGALMGDMTFNGTKMWSFSPGITITNKVYFSALPVGFALSVDKSQYRDMNSRAVFWTADEKDGDIAWARYLVSGYTDFYAAECGKGTLRASVRCVR